MCGTGRRGGTPPEGCVYMCTCILYTAVVMYYYMCTAGLTAAAHVYMLYALYPYTIYCPHACRLYTFYTAKIHQI